MKSLRRLLPFTFLLACAFSCGHETAFAQEPTARQSPPDRGAEVSAPAPTSPTAEAVGAGAQDLARQANGGGAPLTAGRKMRRALRSAFLSPEGYARTAFSAAVTEATEEDLPHKDAGDRVADGLSRFAIKFSTRATRTFFGSGVYPVLFRQDPRYEPSRSKNVGGRALHAVSRVFVTRGDGGGLQPNYSSFAGSLSASALANLWERSTPGRDRVGADATLRRFGTSFASDALNNLVFREFWPDIRRLILRR
jgi:hypothetical protein